LRERKSDIALLASHFLESAAPDKKLSREAKQRLATHSWPGNVRELEQVVGRAAALTDGSEISAEDLEMGVLAAVARENSPLDMASMPTDLKQAQDAFTREFVRQALEESAGVRSKAAAKLGISERTLYRILSADSADTGI